MRLAFLSWEAKHAVPVGGVGVHVSDLAAALARQGHEVHVFTRLGKGQRLFDDVFGVFYHRCPFEPRDNFVDEMAESMAPSFLHYLHEAESHYGRFDLVHCHDWLPLPAGLRLKGEGAAPLAVTFHTTEWGRSGEWPKTGDARRISRLEHTAVEAADTLIVVNQQVRYQVETLYHSPDWKTALIYQGIDLDPFDRDASDPGDVKQSIGLDPMAPMVLFVGSLEYRKGPDLLLEATPAVLETNPEARFVLVGEGRLREHLEKEADRFGVQHAVRFVGWKPFHDLIALYRSCDLVCAPSRTDPFGIVPLSAWAAGKPVVASRVGGAAEPVLDGTNGFLVSLDPEAVAAAIHGLFEDFDHLRWMGRNGRVAAETAFTWDAVARQTLAAYARSRRLQTASQE